MLTQLILCSTLLASPDAEPKAAAAVEAAFLKPLAERERERSRFSRVMRPPTERRLEVERVFTDATGARFWTFTIAEGRAGQWVEGVMTGCVYPEKRAVFVRRGGELRPAEAYLGKSDAHPAPTACVAADPQAGA